MSNCSGVWSLLCAELLVEKFFTFHKTMCSLTGSMVFPMMFNATKEVSLDFWSLYLRHYGVGNAINRLVRFTDLIEAGDFDGAVSELKSGIDAELLNY